LLAAVVGVEESTLGPGRKCITVQGVCKKQSVYTPRGRRHIGRSSKRRDGRRQTDEIGPAVGGPHDRGADRVMTDGVPENPVLARRYGRKRHWVKPGRNRSTGRLPPSGRRCCRHVGGGGRSGDRRYGCSANRHARGGLSAAANSGVSPGSATGRKEGYGQRGGRQSEKAFALHRSANARTTGRVPRAVPPRSRPTPRRVAGQRTRPYPSGVQLVRVKRQVRTAMGARQRHGREGVACGARTFPRPNVHTPIPRKS
jgi:hypothetical protein